jgi:hypothetical protein
MSFGPEYPKINTLYKRDPLTKIILTHEAYSEEYFEYLCYNPWQWTEKLDGTNIRLNYDCATSTVTVGGRTDRAVIPKPLLQWINAHIDVSVWQSTFTGSEGEITIYGEGVGPGIQSNPHELSEPEFIMFDVKIGRFWLSQDDVEGIAKKLGFRSAPRVDYPYSIVGAADLVRRANYIPKMSGKFEGFVGHPSVSLRNDWGERITCKIKAEDFRKLKEYYDKAAPVLA